MLMIERWIEREREREREIEKNTQTHTHVPSIVIRRVCPSTHARSSGRITHPIRIRAVVKTQLVLTHLPIVPRLAHTPRHRILDTTPSIETTVVLAILCSTVVAQIRRGALHCAEPITHAVALAK